MVIKHGDCKSPKDRLVGPLPNGHFMAYKWGRSQPLTNWDDPPSRDSYNFTKHKQLGTTQGVFLFHLFGVFLKSAHEPGSNNTTPFVSYDTGWFKEGPCSD